MRAPAWFSRFEAATLTGPGLALAALIVAAQLLAMVAVIQGQVREAHARAQAAWTEKQALLECLHRLPRASQGCRPQHPEAPPDSIEANLVMLADVNRALSR